MGAWSTKLEGLRLQVPSGWYELASHLVRPEVRRLAKLIVHGSPELDQMIELELGELELLAPKLSLSRCILLVRVPEDAPEGRLESLQAQLGPVPLGLVQHERPSAWPDVTWQERFIKGPLLSVLKRELRDEANPFAAFGIGNFPLDEIARLTPEPIELLEIVELAVDHRIRHAAVGIDADDWLRSALWAAADRVAHRLLRLPEPMLRRAIDVIVDTPEGSRSILDDREASLALTHAGLAWSEGADLLLSPLASFGLSPRGIGRLVLLLPEDAWSEAGKQAIHAGVPDDLPPLRLNLIAPEPPYATWPALVPLATLDELRATVLAGYAEGSERELARAEFELLDARLREIESGPSEQGELRARLYSLRAALDPREGWLELLEAGNTALDELDDAALVALDFERGGLRRFDRVDRLAAPIGGDAARLVALVRWRGVTVWLGRVTRVSEIEMLTAQAELALAGARGDVRIEVASRALVGDLWALQQRYRKAIEWWERAERGDVGERARSRLGFRVLLGLIRMDDPAVFDLFDNYAQILLPHDPITLQILMTLHASFSRSIKNRPMLRRDLENLARNEVVEISAAIEHHDWPSAARLMRELEVGDASRSRLVRAWVQASLNDLDDAALAFADIAAADESTFDSLARALAKRGLALVALQCHRPNDVVTRLEEALEIERHIEITDYALLEIDIAIWLMRASQGHKIESIDLKSAINTCVNADPFMRSGLNDAFMRLGLLVPSQLPKMVSQFTTTAPLSPRLSRDLVQAILTQEPTPQLLELARKLAHDDPALLDQIDRHADLSTPPPRPR